MTDTELAALGPTLGVDEFWELLGRFLAWAAEDHGRARRFAARLLVVLGAARLEQTASAIVEVELMMEPRRRRGRATSGSSRSP